MTQETRTFLALSIYITGVVLIALFAFLTLRTHFFTSRGYTREVLRGHAFPQWVLPSKGEKSER